MKIMTKYEMLVTEYDPTGYYYPKYKTIQKVIASSLEGAITESIKRTPSKSKLGGGWTKIASVITSEDIIIN